MADDQYGKPPGPLGEEDAVRALFHGYADQLEPAPDALRRIRYEVPRRRARRHHLTTGAVAAVMLLAVAVPSFSGAHLMNHPGEPQTAATFAQGGDAWSTSPSPVPSSPRPSASSASPSASASESPTGSPTAGSSSSSDGGGSGSGSGGGQSVGSGGAPSTTAAGTPSSTPTSTPACRRSDLGHGTAQQSPADAQGRTYGSFTVYNVSGHSCTITGQGSLRVDSGGGGQQVQVADYHPGDPVNLPDPSTAPAVLKLDPQDGYQVQFAWVPESSCANAGTGADRRPRVAAADSPSPAADPSPSAPASPTASPSPTDTPVDPGGLATTYTLTHTPPTGGSAAASLTLSTTCGATVYRAAPVEIEAGQAPEPP